MKRYPAKQPLQEERAEAAQPRRLLARIMDNPQLVASVQDLDARALCKVIHHVGLEDAGEIVALATTEQLARIFDEDLWRTEAPGMKETFDAGRFGLWLEVMLDMGSTQAAERLAEMDADFVTFALARHVLVLDTDELASRMSGDHGMDRLDDAELIDKTLESALCHQFDEYLVIARQQDAWDALLSVLAALDSEHCDFLDRMLRRLCYLSTEYIENNGGLYDVLTADEMLESDVAFEREKRREQEGFVPPQAAASFLELARISSLQEMMESRERDPLTEIHFRTYAPQARREVRQGENGGAGLMRILEQAGVLEKSRQQRVLESDALAGGQELLLLDGLRQFAERDPDASAAQMKAFNYLANVLLSGCSEGRGFRPLDAVETVLSTCNLGLEHMLGPARGMTRAQLLERAVDLLGEHELVKLFRIGWHIQCSRNNGQDQLAARDRTRWKSRPAKT